MIGDYIASLKKTLDAINKKEITDIVGVLCEAHKKNKMIFICGNGGSAATASHMVNDIAKLTITEEKKRIKAIALNDNVPLLTAWANDSKYEDCFQEQLKNFIENEDILIGISSSGNSLNVLKAVEYANQKGGITIGLSGFQGGKLAKLAKFNIVVSSDSVQVIEDVHMVLDHLICLILCQEIQKG